MRVHHRDQVGPRVELDVICLGPAEAAHVVPDHAVSRGKKAGHHRIPGSQVHDRGVDQDQGRPFALRDCEDAAARNLDEAIHSGSVTSSLSKPAGIRHRCGHPRRARPTGGVVWLAESSVTIQQQGREPWPWIDRELGEPRARRGPLAARRCRRRESPPWRGGGGHCLDGRSCGRGRRTGLAGSLRSRPDRLLGWDGAAFWAPLTLATALAAVLVVVAASGAASRLPRPGRLARDRGPAGRRGSRRAGDPALHSGREHVRNEPAPRPGGLAPRPRGARRGRWSRASASSARDRRWRAGPRGREPRDGLGGTGFCRDRRRRGRGPAADRGFDRGRSGPGGWLVGMSIFLVALAGRRSVTGIARVAAGSPSGGSAPSLSWLFALQMVAASSATRTSVPRSWRRSPAALRPRRSRSTASPVPTEIHRGRVSGSAARPRHLPVRRLRRRLPGRVHDRLRRRGRPAGLDRDLPGQRPRRLDGLRQRRHLGQSPGRGRRAVLPRADRSGDSPRRR